MDKEVSSTWVSLSLDDAYQTKLYVAYIEKHSSLVFKIVPYTLEMKTL